ncbi:MAG: ribbon-helix-helix protein, CopG family [Cetobacterium sp.]
MERTQISLVLGKELLAKFDAIAKKELRSRNNLIEKIIIDLVEGHK